MITKALKMMKDFINGEYEPLDFSYDFPDFLVQNYDDMAQENTVVNDLLNENMPEICAEYEVGKPPDEFIKNTKAVYDEVVNN